MKDLDVLAAKFDEEPIPREKRFLLKYFTTPLQQAFLKYYLTFGEIRCFPEHAGFVATRAYLRHQKWKLHKLLEAHEQAKSSMDFEGLWIIESGKYRDAYRKR